MVNSTQHSLDAIIKIVSKNPTLSLSLNKKKVYKKVRDLLNELAGGSWTYRHIGNLHRGSGSKPGKEIRHAINRLHKQLTRKPRPRPADNEQAIRTLKVYCTLDELHKAQRLHGTRERIEKLLQKETPD